MARRRRSSRRRSYTKSAGPLVGFATFAAGSYLGEYATDRHIRPWMQNNKYLGNSLIGMGAVLLGLSYATRRFTNRRGIRNLGTGAAAYMAAKGVGMLYQAFKGQ